MLTSEEKKAVVEKFGKNAQDTGSSQVQVALLTRRIEYLTDHLKINKKDFSSRYGLLKLVGQRRRLLKYLAGINLEGYRALIKDLGLRK